MSVYDIERRIALLERELDEAVAEDDEAEQRALTLELRELERELADAQRWEDEGRGRGWL